MSVTVSGIMINPVGEPVVNAQITLTAVANSLTVLNTFSVTVRTDNTGAYRIQLEEGSYSITVAVNGRSFVYGAVTLDDTTGPSTLNQLLKQQIMESELTPDVILYFRQIQQQVANDLATIKVLENSASNSAISAGHSRDEARQYASDLSAALATAKGYRDQSGISANAAALSQQKSATSESKAKASEDSASLSEQHTLAYRNAAQLAAATAADDASTLAAEQTAAKIKLSVKTDADRAEAARSASEQIETVVDNTARQVAQQHGEAVQAASNAQQSENNAAESDSSAKSAAALAVQSKQLAAGSAELSQQNATLSTADKNATEGFRNEARLSAQEAKEAAESIDISSLGIGLPNQSDIANFDWQNFAFASGANYVTNYNTWVNPPAGVTYNAGTRVSIRVIYISNIAAGPRMGLEITPDTGAAVNFKVYKLLCVGAAGSRVFTFNQEWNSANPIPITGGGTGGKTVEDVLLNLGLGDVATQITLLTTRITTLEADAFTSTKIDNTPWINMTLGSGWTGSVARYRKVLGMVQVVVSLSNTAITNGATIATLPVGYRPTSIVQIVPFATFPAGTGPTYPARVVFSTEGSIQLHQTAGYGELNFVVMFALK
ncbi:prophage tail fiber N-terminal domain-containing protein [Yersinia enterocolitica]